jgi:hypothetical protein
MRGRKGLLSWTKQDSIAMVEVVLGVCVGSRILLVFFEIDIHVMVISRIVVLIVFNQVLAMSFVDEILSIKKCYHGFLPLIPGTPLITW